ncbi:hypothetical protein PROFUN_11910 [Planoprotostelium fungivorum]|uniref:Uncharacterized protein n=1 Tax=Planoprotostelium fungivorum TaxID=1890364 RepID=A0A2P6N935_9EUKA|nr:hypothetical protein PROFUN_11910 [Planoprotostelium fungivorum]
MAARRRMAATLRVSELSEADSALHFECEMMLFSSWNREGDQFRAQTDRPLECKEEKKRTSLAAIDELISRGEIPAEQWNSVIRAVIKHGDEGTIERLVDNCPQRTLLDVFYDRLHLDGPPWIKASAILSTFHYSRISCWMESSGWVYSEMVKRMNRLFDDIGSDKEVFEWREQMILLLDVAYQLCSVWIIDRPSVYPVYLICSTIASVQTLSSKQWINEAIRKKSNALMNATKNESHRVRDAEGMMDVLIPLMNPLDHQNGSRFESQLGWQENTWTKYALLGLALSLKVLSCNIILLRDAQNAEQSRIMERLIPICLSLLSSTDTDDVEIAAKIMDHATKITWHSRQLYIHLFDALKLTETASTSKSLLLSFCRISPTMDDEQQHHLFDALLSTIESKINSPSMHIQLIHVNVTHLSGMIQTLGILTLRYLRRILICIETLCLFLQSNMISNNKIHQTLLCQEISNMIYHVVVSCWPRIESKRTTIVSCIKRIEIYNSNEILQHFTETLSLLENI